MSPAGGVTIPVVLVALAVIDGAFAGFRAGAGRNARIRKRDYNLLAARRGVAVSMVGLTGTAVIVLTGSAGHGYRYADLVEAGGRMLVVLLPYAVAVVVSLAGYWLLPMRESTFMILVGLGPLTLVRPAVVVAAAAAAAHGSPGRLIWAAAAAAAAGVLVVEPWVHRRWYGEPS